VRHVRIEPAERKAVAVVLRVRVERAVARIEDRAVEGIAASPDDAFRIGQRQVEGGARDASAEFAGSGGGGSQSFGNF
jgi:hypothetical protein